MHGQVVEHVLLLLVHAPDAFFDDHRQFVAVGRIVGQQVRHGVGQQVAVAVLVLEPFARQRGPSRRGADQESLAAHVARGPDQVADALQAEHGIVDEEGDGIDVVGGVGRTGGDEGRHGARFRYALFQQLAVLGLAVVQERFTVHRVVELPHRGIDAGLPEQGLHAEGARLVGDDGHDQVADFLVAHQVRQDVDEGHGRRHLPVGPLVVLAVLVLLRRVQRREGRPPGRHVAAEGPAPLVQILDLLAVLGRLVEGHFGHVFVGNGDPEPVPEGQQVAVLHLLDLVGAVGPLPAVAHAVSLDRLHQDDRRRPLGFHGRLVRVVDLERIVAAPPQVLQLGVGQVFHHLLQVRMDAEELVPDVFAGGHAVLLVLAVHRLVHAVHEETISVLFQEGVPVAAPDALDDVPSRAPEDGLEFLDDLVVAPDGTVEPLQVAIDHEDEVVEVFDDRHGDGAEGLGFVHLSVAHHDPHLGIARFLDPPVFEVLHETGLVDARDCAEAHGHRGEFPEVRHQPGVGIGRQAGRIHFVAEVLELIFGDAAFEVGPRVDAGRGVALDEEKVAFVAAVPVAEEVVEPHLVERRGRRVGGDVPAYGGVGPVGPDHHGERVPAHDVLDAPFQVAVAGIGFLQFDGERVDVRRVGGEGQAYAGLGGPGLQRREDAAGPLRVALRNDVLNRFEPFVKFQRCYIGFHVRRHQASPGYSARRLRAFYPFKNIDTK